MFSLIVDYMFWKFWVVVTYIDNIYIYITIRIICYGFYLSLVHVSFMYVLFIIITYESIILLLLYITYHYIYQLFICFISFFYFFIYMSLWYVLFVICYVCFYIYLLLTAVTCMILFHTFYWLTSVRIRSYSGPYFPAFGLNTERYRVRTLFTQCYTHNVLINNHYRVKQPRFSETYLGLCPTSVT